MNNRLKTILAATILMVLGYVGSAQAAPGIPGSCTLGNGSICIVLQDQLGNPIIGDASTKVKIVTEGPNGNIGLPANFEFANLVDGGFGDEDLSADGDIEISMGTLAGAFNTPYDYGSDWYYEVTSTSGYINYTSPNIAYLEYTTNYSYADSDPSPQDGLLFTVKANIATQLPLGTTLTGTTMTLSNTTSCNGAYVDGGGSDADGNDDGAIYFKCAASAAPDTITAVISKSGYLNYTDSSQSVSNGSQVVIDAYVNYPFVVTAQDELGSAITLTTSNVTFGGLTEISKEASGGSVYLAATGGPLNLDLTINGFITTTSTGALTYSAAGVQQTVDFDTTDGPQAQYALKILSADDELGGALTITGTPFSATGFSIQQQTVDTAIGYVAAAPMAGNLEITLDGYVTQTVAVTPNAVAQQTIDFASGTVGAVDGNTLQFSLRINAQDELGNTFTGGTLVQNGGSATACTEDGATGQYYCAVPAGETTAVSASMAGYSTTNVATAGNASASAQTVQDMLDATGTPVQFTLRANIENEVGAAVTGATVDQNGGSAVSCAEDGTTGQYYCAIPDTETTALTVAVAGYVTASPATAGAATEAGAQVVQDLTDATGTPVQFTLKVNLESEIGTAITGATVDQNGGSAVSCSEDGTTGQYYCAVPDGETTALTVSAAGYIGSSPATAGAAAVAGPQTVQDLTAATGVPLQYTLRANLEDELGNAITGATMAQSGGSAVSCAEDGTTGQYYCAVPDAETTALSVSAAGYVTASPVTAGPAAVVGPQVVQDLTNATGVPLAYTLRANIEDELGNALTGATVDQNGGSAVSCSEDAATGQYYCAIPDGEDTALTVAAAGYVTASQATAGAAAEAGPQVVQDMTDATGTPVQYTLVVNMEDELGNIVTGATVDQNGGSAVPCSEDGATGNYYCAVLDGETTALTVTATGYINASPATAGAAAVAGPQTVQDMTKATGSPVQYTLAVNMEDELGNVVTGATVTQNGGSAVVCTEDGTTGNYYCAIPDGETTAITVTAAGYIDASLATAGAAAVVGPQVVQDMTKATGVPVQYTLRVNLEDELGNVITGATVDQSGGSAVSCTEDGTTGQYYCAVPDAEATALTVSAAGYVSATPVTAGAAATAGPQVVQDLTAATGVPLQYTLRANIENEIGTALTGATVAQSGGSAVSCTEDAATGQYYCAVPDGETTALSVVKAGYVTASPATAGAAAVVGPQVVQDLTNATGVPVQYTLRVNVEDELGNVFTSGTAVQNGGSAVACSEDGATGQYYCPVPSGETTAVTLSMAGYVKKNKASSGAASSVTQKVQDMTDATGTPVQFTLRANIQDELGNALTGATVDQNGGSAASCTEDGVTGQYYCAVLNNETTALTVDKAGIISASPVNLGGATENGTQTVQDLTLATGSPVSYTLRTNIEDELGNALTGATVTQNGGSAVSCIEDGTTGQYYCAIPDTETTALTVAAAGYVTASPVTVGGAAVAGPQLVQDLTLATGVPVQYTLVANVEDELGNALTGATVAQSGGSAVSCVEDGTTGNYYCAVPDGETTALTVALAGFVTASPATAGAAAVAGPQTVQDLTLATGVPVQYTLRANVEDELGNVITGATVSQNGGSSVSCVEDAATGQYYCAVPDGETTALTAVGAAGGYVTASLATAGAAAEAGPQVVQDMTAATGTPLQFTLRVNIEDELGNVITGATVDQNGGSAVSCVEDGATGQYYCAVPDTETTALTVVATGYVTASPVTAGAAASAGPQLVQDMTAATGAPVQYTLKANIEDELGNVITGATVDQNGGSTVSCTEDGVTGIYYCAVPDGETTALTVAIAGYVTASPVTAGAAAVAGPQIVQDLTDATGAPVQFTLRANIEDELGNALTGATVDQNGGSVVPCTEDGTTGQYYCAVPDTETTALTVVSAGFISASPVTLGGAAVAGPQAVQDLTLATGVPVTYTLRANIEDELGNALTGATVAQSGGSAVSCVEDGTTGQYYCAVPDGETTALTVALAGYVTASPVTVGAAAVAGPQAVQDLTLATGVPVQYTLRANAEDELGNVLTGATVSQNGGSSVSCVEDAATGQYYCAVPDGETTALTVVGAAGGYVTASLVTAGAAAEAGPQVVQDMTAATGTPLQFTLRANIEDELGNVITGATVDQNGGSAVSCVEDGATGQYYCAVPDGETTALTVAIAGYVTASPVTAGAAAAAGPQLVQDMTAATGAPIQYTLKANIEDELGNVITGATVDQNGGSAVSCTEDGVTGIYYCAVPDTETTALTVVKAGYVSASPATAGAAAVAGPQVVQDLTMATGVPVQYTLKATVEDELANPLSGATVVQNGGSAVTCTEDGMTGIYYCAAPAGETSAMSVSMAGYITTSVGSLGLTSAATQRAQDFSSGTGTPMQFTLKVNVEDELAGALTGATVAQVGGSAVSCVEDGTTGQYYCAVPDTETTAVSASKAGYIGANLVTLGGATEAGAQTVQDMTAGTGTPLQYTLKVNVEDELANIFTGGTLAQSGGSAVSCVEDGATGVYYCPVPDGETTSAIANKAGYSATTVADAGAAAEAGPQIVSDMTDATGTPVQYSLRVNVEDELGNIVTGATVDQNGGSAVSCSEDGATGQYYCAVLDTETTAVTVTAAAGGYVTTSVATAGAAAAAGPQTVQDMTKATGAPVQFTLRVNLEDELGTAITGATVDQNGGSAVSCIEDGTTGQYYCAIPDTETTALTVAAAGYVTASPADAGAAAAAGPQIVQDLTDATGVPAQFTLRVNLEDELGNVITGATVAQSGGSAVSCTEDGTTGQYYCAVPDAETTALSVSAAGYVTASPVTAGAAAVAGPQVVQDLTDATGVPLAYTLVVQVEDELANILTGGTVTQVGGSAVACSEDGATGFYYCPIPDAETTAVSVSLAGYVTTSVLTAGAAAEAGPQATQDMTAGTGTPVQFTVRVNIEDELANTFTGGTVAQVGGSAIACTEDAATGQYYCAIPDGETTAIAASMAGYSTTNVATAGGAAEAGPQIVQDMLDATGVPVQYTLRVNVEDELGNILTGATVDQNGGSAVACTEDGVTGQYYCAIPDGETTAVTVAAGTPGFVTASIATAGAAAEAGAQTVQDLTDATGAPVQYTLRVNLEDELGNLITGATVDQNGGSAVSCTEDGATGQYYCAVPDGETTALTVAAIGYVTASPVTAGAAAIAGPQAVQDLTDATGVPLQYTLMANIEDELGNVLTGATVAQNGGTAVACAEDGATGQYYCAVPNGETTALTVAATGYVTASPVTAGAAAVAGPQTVQDLTDATGVPVQFTLRVNVEDELGNIGTGITVAQNGGSSVACAEDGATGSYYCAVPDAETTAVTGTKAGYTATNLATAGAAAEAGPQVVQNMTTSGTPVDYTLVVNVQDELGNVVTGATVAQVGGSAVACSEDGATGIYYCPVPDGETTAVSVAAAGYVTASIPTAGAATESGAQTVQDMTDATGTPLQFTLRANIEDELGNVLTGATVAQNGGSAVACAEDGVTGQYYCAVLDGETTSLTVSAAGYVTSSPSTAGAATEAGAQIVQDLTDATGTPVQFTLRANVQDELGNILTGATVAQNGGSAVACAEDGATGQYYCAVPDGETTAINASLTGFVTSSPATAGAATEAGAQIVQDLTDGSGSEVLYQIAVLSGAGFLEDEVGTALTLDGTEDVGVCLDAACAAMENPVAAAFDGTTFYIAPATEGAKWMKIEKTGFAAAIDGVSINAAAAGPQVNPAFTAAAGDGLAYVPTQIVTTDPTDAIVGANASVTIEIQDAAGTVVPSASTQFTVNLSGSAVGSAVTTGTLVSGANTNTLVVQAASGTVVLTITNDVAETVDITLTDSAVSGLAVTSAQNIVFTPSVPTKLVFLTNAQTLEAGVAGMYSVQAQDALGNPVSTLGTAITVNLASDSTGNDEFRTTAAGAAVTSVTIATSTDTVSFYYVDTKAGTPTITASATGLTSDTVGATITANAAVATIPTNAISTTATVVDATQPTGQSDVITIKDSTNTYTLAIITIPHTESGVYSQQIVANGTSMGTIKVTIYDSYGNVKVGEAVTLASSIVASSAPRMVGGDVPGSFRVVNVTTNGVTSSPDSVNSDVNGQATFQVSSTTSGTASFQLKVNGVNYGSPVTVLFASSDTTAPAIDATVSSSSLQDGDLIGSTEAVIIRVGISDTGTGATGVDLTSITVTVKNSSNATVAGTTNTTSCASAANCQVSWTPTAALAAGQYTITLSVKDVALNEQTQSWTVRVSSSVALENIITGPSDGSAVFNPMTGGNMMITFQAPSAGTVSIEIYRRDGRLAYSTVAAVVPGYNEILWNGRGLSGAFVANGVYVFRLRANLATGSIEQTGKLAIFKQ